jgi:putative sterol carrier protein
VSLKDEVKRTLGLLQQKAPGRAVEVRVPPYAAVQVVGGGTHTRGTPRAVVETDPETWLELATGTLGWHEAVDSGRVRASGERADQSAYLPLSAPDRTA